MTTTNTVETTPRTLWDALVAQYVRWADRLHADEDARAIEDGLTVARWGVGGRTYRDPRFDARRGVQR